MTYQTKRRMIGAIGTVVLALLSILSCSNEGRAQSMSSYAGTPPFVASSVAPNILLILDNSGSMNNSAYTAAFNTATVYSGIFTATECYSYSAGLFSPDSATADPATPGTCGASFPWSGNLLNYVSMREFDLVKVVMIGGTCTVARDSLGNCSRIKAQDSFSASACCTSQVQQVTLAQATGRMPAGLITASGTYFFYLNGLTASLTGKLCVKPGSGGGGNSDPGPPTSGANCGASNLFTLVADHPETVSGTLQKIGTKARLALMEFNTGEGGHMAASMGSPISTVISQIEAAIPQTWTPLGEALYEGVRYFAQLPAAYFGTDYVVSTATDPFYYTSPTWSATSQYVTCCKNFVILFTDGQPTQDSNVPNSIKDFAHTAASHGVSNHCTTILGCTGNLPHSSQNTAWHNANSDHHDNCSAYYGGSTSDSCVAAGSHILDDVAYFAHTTDLRPDAGGTNPCPGGTVTVAVLGETGKCLGGSQTISLYTFFAFGTGANILKDAAKVGGFIDRNGNGLPDNANEYDTVNNATGAAGADGIPDNYFEAVDAFQLEGRLLATLAAILHEASSGTAVSVLSTSSTGEGSLYQSFFYTSTIEASTLNEVRWTGYSQGLFLDPFGNIREDTDGDGALTYQTDYIITTRFDNNPSSTTYNHTVADRFLDTNGDGNPDTLTPLPAIDINQVRGIWEGGKQLAFMDSSSRRLLTWLDKNNNGAVDSGEQITFDIGHKTDLEPYLRPSAAPFTKEGIINFITGCGDPATASTCPEQSLLRYRKLLVTPSSGSPVLRVWKLGDPISATPTVVSAPSERFDLLYGDATYSTFLNDWKNRRQVVYVGANDGMLHAFNGGFYNRGDSPTISGQQHGYFTNTPTADGRGQNLGDELWGFIPQELLPHLRWLADPLYSHVYYVDLKPKVTDVKVFCDSSSGITTGCLNGQPSTNHSKGWGTILIGGFRLGGSCSACTTTGTKMTVTADFDYNAGTPNTSRDFLSAYFVLDITDPDKEPVLLWSFSDPGLGLSSSYPTLVRMNLDTDARSMPDNAKWYVVFGSGMTGYDGTTAQQGNFYAVDLVAGPSSKTAFPVRDPASSPPNAFMGDLIAVDYDLDWRTDAVYAGSQIAGGPPAQGIMFRLTTAEKTIAGTGHGCPASPCSPAGWGIKLGSGASRGPTEMLASFPTSGTTKPGPMLAAPTVTVDDNARTWVFFGSGRFLSSADKTNTETQYLFGVKDRVLSRTCSEANGAPSGCPSNDLVDVSSVSVCVVCTGNQVTGGPAGVTTLTGTDPTTTLQGLIGTKHGWFTTLPGIPADPGPPAVAAVLGERSIVAPTIIGGVVFFPTFIPRNDICQATGTSYLYGLFYLTGSAYTSPIFSGTAGTTTSGGNTVSNRRTLLGDGLASQMAVQVTNSQGCAGGLKGFSQSSTGAIASPCTKPAQTSWSQYVSWIQQRD